MIRGSQLSVTSVEKALVELEQKILGWFLYDAPGTISHIAECLSVAKHFDPLHVRIFNAIAVATNAGKDRSTAAIALVLKDDPGLQEIGGIEYLRKCESAAPAVANERDGGRQFTATLYAYKAALAREEITEKAKITIDDLEAGAPDALLRFAALGDEARELELGLCQRTPLSVGIEEFLAQPIAPRTQLLSPWLQTSGLAMVHAWRGVGKTHFALGVAIACASGSEFLRWRAPQPCRVLYVDGEMSASDMQPRIRSATSSGNEIPPDHFRLITPDFLPPNASVPNLLTVAGQDAIAPDLKNCKLVIFDNIATLFRTTDDTNQAGSWLAAQDYILSLRRHGIAVLLVDHDNKMGGNRGTSAKHDVLDTVIHLKEPPDYISSQGARFEVHFTKHRGFRGKDAVSFEAQLIDIDDQTKWVMKDTETIELDRVREMLAAGLTDRAIRDELNIGGSKLTRLKETIRSGATR